MGWSIFLAHNVMQKRETNQPMGQYQRAEHALGPRLASFFDYSPPVPVFAPPPPPSNNLECFLEEPGPSFAHNL